MPDFFIRIGNKEAEAKLRRMAQIDLRTIAGETVMLINKEWEERFPGMQIQVGSLVDVFTETPENPNVTETD